MGKGIQEVSGDVKIWGHRLDKEREDPKWRRMGDIRCSFEGRDHKFKVKTYKIFLLAVFTGHGETKEQGN